MTGFFIKHPLSAIVAALLLTIFGLLSAFSLPIDHAAHGDGFHHVYRR